MQSEAHVTHLRGKTDILTGRRLDQAAPEAMDLSWERQGPMSSLNAASPNNNRDVLDQPVLPPTNTSSPNDGGSFDHAAHHHNDDTPTSFFLAFLILAAFCYIIRPRPTDPRFRRAPRTRLSRLERIRVDQRRKRMENVEYRERMVMNNLFIQKVLQRDAATGQLTLGDVNSPCRTAPDADTTDFNDDEDEGNTCAICLEPFCVGEELAWSRSFQSPPVCRPVNESDNADEENNTSAETEEHLGTPCNHVFHKDCVVSWLMNPDHDGCPFCRVEIVKEPEGAGETDDGESPDQQTIELSPSQDSLEVEGTNDGSLQMAFVVVHGLVSCVRRASCNLMGADIDLEGNSNDGNKGKEYEVLKKTKPLRRVRSFGERSPRKFASIFRPKEISCVEPNPADANLSPLAREELTRSPLRRTLSDSLSPSPQASTETVDDSRPSESLFLDFWKNEVEHDTSLVSGLPLHNTPLRIGLPARFRASLPGLSVRGSTGYQTIGTQDEDSKENTDAEVDGTVV